MSLSESMNIFEKARMQVESGQGAVAEIIKLKLKNVLNRNPGYSTYTSYTKIFQENMLKCLQIFQLLMQLN
jgi:hypothetical protein